MSDLECALLYVSHILVQYIAVKNEWMLLSFPKFEYIVLGGRIVG